MLRRNEHSPLSGGVLKMMWRWRYFFGAVVIAAYFLIRFGAPPLAVAAGIAGAATFMWRRHRSSRLS